MDGVFPGLEGYAMDAKIRKAMDAAREKVEREENNND